MGRWLAIMCVRGSVACYFGYVVGELVSNPSRRCLLWQRRLWSLGAVLLLVHILLAFAYFHDGSHASAIRETARQTEALIGIAWGGGVYVNEVFVALWLLDAALMWLPRAQRGGSSLAATAVRRWRVARHGVAGFMMFNATVVFGPPFWRWLVPLAVVALFIVHRCTSNSGHPVSNSADRS